ncbi:MAG: YlxR family protein [Nocardioides sp.]
MASTTTTPTRTCIGCRGRAAKHTLLRVVARMDEQGLMVVAPDPEATAPGRGAHLHPTPECYSLAVRRRAFGRALRLPGAPSTAPVDEFVTSRAARHHQDD